MTLRRARFPTLDSSTLYAILRLRSEVFVVEQECAYLDPDGLDVEAEHWWIEDGDGAINAYLRAVPEADGHLRLGRVVTAPRSREQGLAAQLLAATLDATNPPWRLDAQSRLVGWYERFGFEVTGPEFLEDGIAHVPMKRLNR